MDPIESPFPKRPPRLERIFAELDPFYFVTFNTFPRRPILATTEVHTCFRSFAQKAKSFNVAVGRYVIMPDHIHLFVMLPREGLVLGEWTKALKRTLGKTLIQTGHSLPHWQKGAFDHLMRSGESYTEK